MIASSPIKLAAQRVFARKVGGDTGEQWKPYPWQVEALKDRTKVFLATGTAGGGKSRLYAEKIHAYMKDYKNAMGLMVRKTRESMTNGTVLFFEREIISGDRAAFHVPSKHRFEYSNGSVLAYGGMADREQREHIRSVGINGGVDIIWMEEASLFKEEDYNELLPRLRGTAADWRQIGLTTNPDASAHWINRRLILGKEASVHLSTFRDNPANPADYEQTLNLITGTQHDRLVKGLWCNAQGMIYDNWTDKNVDGDKAFYRPELNYFWWIDDGYKNPRVVLVAQELPDGTVIVIAEYYKTQQLFEATLNDLRAMGYGSPQAAIHDPAAAEFAAFLWNQGIQTVAADNTVSEGIKAVRGYIKDGNDVISLFVNPSCVNLIREIASYSWDTTIAAAGGDPKPIKEDDHADDALRYGLFTKHAYRVPRGFV